MSDLHALLTSTDLVNLVAYDQSLVIATNLAHFRAVVTFVALCEMGFQVVV